MRARQRLYLRLRFGIQADEQDGDDEPAVAAATGTNDDAIAVNGFVVAGGFEIDG